MKRKRHTPEQIIKKLREAALAFAKATSALPPGEQVEAVTARLNELNGQVIIDLVVRPYQEAVTDVALTLVGDSFADITLACPGFLYQGL